MAQEGGFGAAGESFDGFSVLAGGSGDKVACEKGDVLQAVPRAGGG